MVNRIVLNTVSYHGSGAVKEIGPELSARGFKKALVCSGKHVVKSGEINKILDPMKAAGIDYALFTDIKANPTIENVQNGVQAFKDAGADCIVAVGGGSCGGAIDEVLAAGCDTLVTADLKYNHFEEAKYRGLNLLDAGHFETENPVCAVLARILREALPELTVLRAQDHKDETQFL